MGTEERRAQRHAARLFDSAAEGTQAPATAPLRCTSCNAPVPLGTGDVATCLACGAQVPIPDAIRTLRDADRAGVTDRAAAEKLYRRLGKPPSAVLRAWASFWVLLASGIGGLVALLIALGVGASIIALLGLELICHWLAPTFGVDFIDRYGGGTTYMAFAAMFAVFGALPMWLVNYMDSSSELRSTLQRNLAASLPERPGFPSTCRECGAALDVPARAYGVRCIYCNADNLVALPASLVAETGRRSSRFHHSIIDASAKAKALRDEQLGLFGLGASVCFVLVLCFGVVGRFAYWLDRDHDTISFADSMRAPRVMQAAGSSSRLVLGEEGWAFEDGVVALNEGEVFELTSADASTCATIIVRNTTTFPFIRLDQPLPWLRNIDGTVGAHFVAPYTGLFQMDMERMAGAHMRWRLGMYSLPMSTEPACQD